MGARAIYEQAHLFVAGIRIHEHLHVQPPSLAQLAALLKVSSDETALLSRRLEELGIIGVLQGGGEHRFFIKDHTRIESLPRQAEASGLADEITLFRQQQDERLGSIEKSVQAKDAKSSIFEDLERALKDPSSVKRKKNPLD